MRAFTKATVSAFTLGCALIACATEERDGDERLGQIRSALTPDYGELDCANQGLTGQTALEDVVAISKRGSYKVGTYNYAYNKSKISLRATGTRPKPYGFMGDTASSAHFQVWFPTTTTGTSECFFDLSNTVPDKNTCRTHESGAAVVTGSFPLILYAHGTGDSAVYHGRLFAHLASHGYIVAAIQFPYTGSNILAPNPVTQSIASFAIGQPRIACIGSTDAACEEVYGCANSFYGPLCRGLGEDHGGPKVKGSISPTDLVNQIGDMSRLVDWVTQTGNLTGLPPSPFATSIDNTKIGAMGFSLGASTVLMLGYHPTLRDARVKAILQVAPVADITTSTLFPASNTVPTLILTGDQDLVSPLDTNAWRVYRNAQPGRRHLVAPIGGTHAGAIDAMAYFTGYFQQALPDYQMCSLLPGTPEGATVKDTMKTQNGGTAGDPLSTFKAAVNQFPLPHDWTSMTQSHHKLCYAQARVGIAADSKYADITDGTAAPSAMSMSVSQQSKLNLIVAKEFFDYQLKGRVQAGCYLRSTLGTTEDGWTSSDATTVRTLSVKDSGTTPAVCGGDCNNNGQVTSAEMTTIDAIIAGTKPLSDCVPADADANGTISSAERTVALNHQTANDCTTVDPTLALISPSSPGATVTGTITLNANGGIKPGAGSNVSVDYFIKSGTGATIVIPQVPYTNSPPAGFRTTWNTNVSTVGDGDYRIVARGRDANDNMTWSKPIWQYVRNHPSQDPTVTLLSPSAGTVSGAVLLNALAAGVPASDGIYLNMVQWSVDDTILGASDSTDGTWGHCGGYGCVLWWDSTRVPDGTHVIRGKVWENTFPYNQTHTTSVTVTVANKGVPPTSWIALIAGQVPPAPTTLTRGVPALMSAGATSTSGIWTVGYYRDSGVFLGWATPTIYGWILNWTPPTSLTPGTHTIYAIARSNCAAPGCLPNTTANTLATSSAPVSVTIN